MLEDLEPSAQVERLAVDDTVPQPLPGEPPPEAIPEDGQGPTMLLDLEAAELPGQEDLRKDEPQPIPTEPRPERRRYN
jgi:hypothetical protein